MSRIQAKSGFTRLLLCGLLTLAGCGGSDQGGDAESAEGAAEAPSESAPVQVENPATITGTVAFEGTVPAPEPIDMSEEPDCAQKHQGQPTKRAVAVSNGRLANVFVYVKEGLSGSHPTPSQPKVLDQVGCEYIPHVMGIQAGQQLTIKNSDGLAHNINADANENRGFNISQPTTMETRRTFAEPEVMIPVRCDIHGWMEAYIGVLEHPYYAVTGEDGSFTIPNLPPGTYVVEAWHEKLGTQTANVTVGPNESKQSDFSYSARSAHDAVVPLGRPLVLHGGHATRGGAGGR